MDERLNVTWIPIGDKEIVLNPATGDWLLVDSGGKDLFLAAAAGKDVRQLNREFPSVSREEIIQLLDSMERMDFRSVKDCGEAHICYDCHQGYFPRLAVLNLTEDCNLKCKYCYVGAGEGKKIKMTPKTAFRIVDEYLAMNPENTGGKISIVMHGGEPLLNYDLVQKLAEYVKPYRDRISLAIQTNASLLTEERVSYLLENGVAIGVSLDGPPEIHNLTRPLQGGKGSFDQVMRGIRIIQSHGLYPGVISVMTRRFAEQIDRVLDFFLENHIFKLTFSPFLEIGRGANDEEDFVTPDILFNAYKRILDRIISFNSQPNRPCDLQERLLTHMAKKIFLNRNEFMCTRAPCGSGRDILGFGVNGDFYACDDFINDPDFWIGSLDQGSVKEQLLKTDVIRKRCNRSMAELPRCRNCVWRSLCGGICHSSDHYSGANGVEETPMCGFYKKLIPYLIETYIRIPELPTLLCAETKPASIRTLFFALSKEVDPDDLLNGEEFEDLLHLHVVNELDTLVFCGDEPMEYPAFPELLRAATKRSSHVVVATNGLRFAEETYTRELFQSGLQYVIVSLPAESAERDNLYRALSVYFRVRQETASGSRMVLRSEASLIDDRILPVLEQLCCVDQLLVSRADYPQIDTDDLPPLKSKLADLAGKGIVQFSAGQDAKKEEVGVMVSKPNDAPEKLIWIDAENYAGRELTEFPANLLTGKS